MEYDLKKPCKNCPFRTDDTAIRFANRERAEEIEESAYRHGFPCHKSAVFQEESFEGAEDDGYVAGENTQHCAGYMIMQIFSGETEWPAVNNDPDIVDAFANKMDWNAPVFQNCDDFLDANTKEKR